MDKTIAGVLAAVGTLVATASGQAAPVQGQVQALQVSSYADLLRPVPNAAQVLAALDAQPAEPAAVEQVQYYYPAPYPAYRYHHHHHHHHRYYRRYYHHHHHHHHHHGYGRPYWER